MSQPPSTRRLTYAVTQIKSVYYYFFRNGTNYVDATGERGSGFHIGDLLDNWDIAAAAAMEECAAVADTAEECDACIGHYTSLCFDEAGIWGGLCANTVGNHGTTCGSSACVDETGDSGNNAQDNYGNLPPEHDPLEESDL